MDKVWLKNPMKSLKKPAPITPVPISTFVTEVIERMVEQVDSQLAVILHSHPPGAIYRCLYQ